MYAGVDIGGTTAKIGIFDSEGTMKNIWSIPTRIEKGIEGILTDIKESLENRVRSLEGTIEGIGLTIPGPVKKMGM